jgi:hypothetical protein
MLPLTTEYKYYVLPIVAIPFPNEPVRFPCLDEPFLTYALIARVPLSNDYDDLPNSRGAVALFAQISTSWGVPLETLLAPKLRGTPGKEQGIFPQLSTSFPKPSPEARVPSQVPLSGSLSERLDAVIVHPILPRVESRYRLYFAWLQQRVQRQRYEWIVRDLRDVSTVWDLDLRKAYLSRNDTTETRPHPLDPPLHPSSKSQQPQQEVQIRYRLVV